jgi:EmrB/QacA subfamily drug resistance transporter
MTSRSNLIPLVVAMPIFLQNIDLMATTVALPDMAWSLSVEPLTLSMVVASYAISLAVFLPLSAWLIHRFGAKRMFSTAIILFAASSALCGIANNAAVLIACRVLQGFSAAMMVPVGRLILLRSFAPSELMGAMVWFTLPPAIGRLLGPLVGGAIVAVASWRWIFLINIPLALIAVLIAQVILSPELNETKPSAFDAPGFLMMGLGLGATLGGIEATSRDLIGPVGGYLLIAGGIVLLGLSVRHCLRSAAPVIDLRILRHKTFRTNVVGALPLRLANSASPFLVPLMLQLAFGMGPLGAGIISSGVAAGSLGTRLVMRSAMRRLSFRTLFLAANLLTALSLAAYGLLTPAMPHWTLFATFLVGGLVTSLCLVALNTIGFVDVPRDETAHATALVAMAQQTTSAVGVVIASALLGLFSASHGGDGSHLIRFDFSATFFAIGLLAALSLIPFSQLHPDEGKDLRG